MKTHFRVVSLLPSGVGMVLVWFCQSSYGIAVNTDSIRHLSTSKGLSDGIGFNVYLHPIFQDTESVFGHVNLYPFIVSIVSSLGNMDALNAAKWLHIVVFGLCVYIVVLWSYDKVKSRTIAIGIGLVSALSPSLVYLYSWALTESVSILFVVASLFAFDKFLTNDKIAWLIFSAFLAALGFLSRYLDGGSVIIIILILLITKRGVSMQKRIKLIVNFSAVSISIIGLFLLKNILQLGRPVNPTFSIGFSFADSIYNLTYEFMDWIFGNTWRDYFERISEYFEISDVPFRIGVIICLAVLLGAVYIYHRTIPLKYGSISTPLAFIIGYIIMMSLVLYIREESPWIPRYIAVIYIPALLVVATILTKFVRQVSRRLLIIFLPILLGWFIIFVNASYDNVMRWRDHDFGYLSKDWRGSETIRYLKFYPYIGLIHSNNIRAVRMNMYGMDDHPEVAFRQLEPELPDGSLHWATDTYIVWFHGWKPYYHFQYDILELMASQGLEIEEVLEDGMIFKTTGRQTFISYDNCEDCETVILDSILEEAKLVATSVFDIYIYG